MTFHVLQALSYFGNTKDIDAFHATMFHGTADRGGKKPTCRNARLAKAVDRPLQLHKNAYNMGHVFEPEGALVVSSAVRDALCAVPKITFTLVFFKTLFRYPFHPGDFSFWETMSDYYVQQTFIDDQFDDPTLYAQTGEFFELVMPTVADLRARFQPLTEVVVKVGTNDFDDQTILISRELLVEHPIFSCGPTVMSDFVFEKLKPFIDWTYFVHGEGSI